MGYRCGGVGYQCGGHAVWRPCVYYASWEIYGGTVLGNFTFCGRIVVMMVMMMMMMMSTSHAIVAAMRVSCILGNPWRYTPWKFYFLWSNCRDDDDDIEHVTGHCGGHAGIVHLGKSMEVQSLEILLSVVELS